MTAAVWIKDEDLQSQYSGRVEAMEEVKYSRSEVMMLLTLLVLVIPYIWMGMRKIYSEWTRISMIGKVRINSSSKNYIFHRTSCRYVQGKARHGYFIHLTYDEAVSQGYRPCYKCFPESKKAQKEDEDDEWELTSESTDTTENEGCGKQCTWCKVRKCTRKKPAHVYCSCTECIQKYTEDLWRGQYDKEEASSSTQGPTGKKGSGTLEYMPPSVNQKGNRPAGQGSKGGKRGRAAMEPVTEEQEGPMLPEESFTQEAEEEPPVYEDYEAVDPGTPDSTEEKGRNVRPTSRSPRMRRSECRRKRFHPKDTTRGAQIVPLQHCSSLTKCGCLNLCARYLLLYTAYGPTNPELGEAKGGLHGLFQPSRAGQAKPE